MEQLSFLDDLYERYTIKKKIKLIEMFAGYGSQCCAFERLQAKGLCEFEQFRIVEWNAYSILAYYYLHSTDKTDYSKGFSKEKLVQILFNWGISLDWNKPATEKQLNNKSEQFLKDVYNATISTHNLVDISRVKGEQLIMGKEERKKCCVVTCYSFPCQDISLAGKMAGISANTRSGLLFQVERILLEMNELNQLPDVLLLENVKELLSEKHESAFKGWLNTLHKLGYESYVKVLNASDYGIPQHRERCFVVSILNSADHYYTFPKPEPLKKVLKDMLEENVDEKYYLSDKQIQEIQQWNAYEKPLETMKKTEQTNISPTLTTRTSEYTASMILVNLKRGYSCEVKPESPTKTNEIDHIGNYSKSNYNQTPIVGKNGIAPAFTENYGQITAITEPTPNLRIRKLTPRECLRLQGLRDNEIDKIIDKFSNSVLYHLAGDSIVVDLLEKVFEQIM